MKAGRPCVQVIDERAKNAANKPDGPTQSHSLFVWESYPGRHLLNILLYANHDTSTVSILDSISILLVRSRQPGRVVTLRPSARRCCPISFESEPTMRMAAYS